MVTKLILVKDGYVTVNIEVDSLVLVDIFKKEVEIPWSIVYEIRAIWQCLGVLDFQLQQQMYGENNQGGDFLSIFGV